MRLSGLLSSINWQEESYPRYQDFIVLPLFAIFFPTVRFFLDRFVFEKIACRLMFGKGFQFKEADLASKKKRINKFKESAWKCIYFLSAEVLALSVTYDEPWFTNTKYFWVGPGDQIWPDQKLKLKLQGLYMYTAGFYTYSIFALIFWETRRSDFGVSMVHHVATVILIVLSYIFRFARVGSVVLALHDASDVFLETGKMSKYSGAETLASGAFILFVLCWIILRLTYYPFWILWSTRIQVKIMSLGRLGCAARILMGPWTQNRGRASTSYDVCNAMQGQAYPSGNIIVIFSLTYSYFLFALLWLIDRSFPPCYEFVQILDKEKHPVEGPVYYYVFNTLLYCLLVLHIYWWVLMNRMLVKQIQARGQLSDDVRSDSEGEDEHED